MIKRRILTVFFLLLIVFETIIFSSCDAIGRGREKIDGKGQVIEKTYSIGEVKNFYLSEIMQINVTSGIEIRTRIFVETGEENAVTVKAYENVLPKISVTEKNGNVYIKGSEKEKYKDDMLQITLILKKPEIIDFDGYFEVLFANNVKADKLELNFNNKTTCDLYFSGESLLLNTKDESSVTIWEGSVNVFKIVSSGKCMIDGEYFKADYADISLKGGDVCIVNVEKQIDLIIESNGKLSYFGEPLINKTVSDEAIIEIAEVYQDD